jgi:hypothetical protein
VTTTDELVGLVKQRMDALDGHLDARVDEKVSEALTDERIRDLIRSSLPLLLEDPEFGDQVRRKIRFGKPEPKLIGTKYARLGLSVPDVEMLHDILLAGQRAGVSRGPSEELRNVFKAVSEGRYEDTAVVRSNGQRQLAEAFRAGRLTPEGYERAVRAMDTAESGYGQQLVGAQYVRELWKGAEAQSKVFGLFRSFEMDAPTAYLPVQATLPVVSFVGESTANNSSNYGTTKTGSNRVQVDAKKLLMHQMWSGEMEEDSLIAFMEFLREEAQRSWAYHMDAILLNGDTTNAGTGNVNLDDADPADTLYYLAFDGIRHAGLVDNTGNSASIGGPIDLAHFRSSKARMLDATYKHDWSHPTDPDDLVYVADPETADAVSFMDAVLTFDKIGDRATTLNGQQARVLNHPLIASMEVSKTEADGKVSTTGANNTKGQIVAFNRRGGVVGTRRQLQTEVERLPATDQTRIVYSTRIGFGRFTPTGSASGIEWADVLYNISL